jgi:hypothetical protein
VSTRSRRPSSALSTHREAAGSSASVLLRFATRWTHGPQGREPVAQARRRVRATR